MRRRRNGHADLTWKAGNNTVKDGDTTVSAGCIFFAFAQVA